MYIEKYDCAIMDEEGRIRFHTALSKFGIALDAYVAGTISNVAIDSFPSDQIVIQDSKFPYGLRRQEPLHTAFDTGVVPAHSASS